MIGEAYLGKRKDDFSNISWDVWSRSGVCTGGALQIYHCGGAPLANRLGLLLLNVMRLPAHSKINK